MRALAYYLPQFHPIPENDRWWGDGFTEWTSVRAAEPLFRGHRQPRVPGDLGYYDLRDDRVRDRQAELAQEAGIEGFAYWHYWFSGRRLLETPSERMLATGRPGLGFCFAWANISWSRAWTGADRQVLVAQEYPGADDHRRHYRALQRAFDDDRYVRVDGRPLFLLFRPGEIPDLATMVEVWREEADRAGEPPPYLVGEADFTNGPPAWLPAASTLLDGIVEYSWIRAIGRVNRVRRKLPGAGRPVRVPYDRMIERLSVRRDGLSLPQYPLVLTGWDNTPRYQRAGVVAEGYAPERLTAAVAAARAWATSLEHPLVILKSWNEWSEGNMLEPDETFGHRWLAACREGLAAA